MIRLTRPRCSSRGKECVYVTNTGRKTVDRPLDEGDDVAVRGLTDTSGQHGPGSFQPQSLVEYTHLTATSESTTATIAEFAAPTNNHLGAMCNTDMFQPFCSTVPPFPSITDGGISSQTYDFPVNIRVPEFHFLTEIDVYGQTFSSIFARPVSEIGTFLQSCVPENSNGSSPIEPLPSELQHYR